MAWHPCRKRKQLHSSSLKPFLTMLLMVEWLLSQLLKIFPQWWIDFFLPSSKCFHTSQPLYSLFFFSLKNGIDFLIDFSCNNKTTSYIFFLTLSLIDLQDPTFLCSGQMMLQSINTTNNYRLHCLHLIFWESPSTEITLSILHHSYFQEHFSAFKKPHSHSRRHQSDQQHLHPH